MSKHFVSVVFNLILAVGLTLSPLAMDKQERGFKRTHYQTQMYDDRPDFSNPHSHVTRHRALSSITRLSTPESHMRQLQEGISRATRSLLITSYGVDDEVFKRGNLYHLLAEARRRGVKVYLYNIDSKDTDDVTFKFFEQYHIAYDAAYTHAKIFAVDDTMVAIGSYSWLSRANTWDNATLCLFGNECAQFVPLLWEDLRYYRNLQFGNLDQIIQYQDDSENEEADTWELDDSTSLHYIHSLKSHREFIANIFENVTSKVVFCVPFSSQDSGYQEDFTRELLARTLRKNVQIYFVCRAEDQNLFNFRNYLGNLLDSPFMHLLAISNIHLKTVLVDDETIAEGSFNLLSASRDEESDFHNHEVTLVLDGEGSKESIQDFYASRVGREVLRVSSGQGVVASVKPELSHSEPTSKAPKASANIRNAHDSPAQRLCDPLKLDWQTSTRGNPYINIISTVDQKEYHIVITKGRGASYSAMVNNVPIKKWYPSQDEAKIVAFEYVG